MNDIVKIPAHLDFDAPKGSRHTFVSMNFNEAVNCSLEEREQAFVDHVLEENGEVRILAMKFHSYTRADGYIYQIWFVGDA